MTAGASNHLPALAADHQQFLKTIAIKSHILTVGLVSCSGFIAETVLRAGFYVIKPGMTLFLKKEISHSFASNVSFIVPLVLFSFIGKLPENPPTLIKYLALQTSIVSIYSFLSNVFYPGSANISFLLNTEITVLAGSYLFRLIKEGN